MPSVLSKHTTESVNLVTSDDSPYGPPHRSSIDRSSNNVTNTKEYLFNGGSIDGSRTGKRVEGVFLGESNGLNTSLHSLPVGRSSNSLDGPREKILTRHDCNLSATNGYTDAADDVNAASDMSNGQPTLKGVESHLLTVKAGGDSSQLMGPKTLEHIQQWKGHRKSHARTHSLSAPQSHDTSLTCPNHVQAYPCASDANLVSNQSSQTHNRVSSPAALSNTLQPPAESSTSSLHATAPRLHHRHTLEVPRLSTGRTSRDFSYPNTASDGSESGRFSPTPRTPRASNTLARAPTRSIHSDMYLDEVPADSDMAKFTESIRQKRASRRSRRKEDEEDDRVVVGTKVDMNHVNWVTAYNMLTGIRFTVSRTNAKMNRELTDVDFDAKHKFSFDMLVNLWTVSKAITNSLQYW